MGDENKDLPADADAGTIRAHFEGKLGEQAGENTKLQVENLTLRTFPGLDTSKPAVQAFIGSYKGELTAEALKGAAAAWDLAPAAKAEPTAEEAAATAAAAAAAAKTPVSDLERQAAGAAGSAASGAAAPGTDGDPDPTAKGLSDFNAEMAKGAEREVAAGAFIDSVFGAAAKGDDRVILDGRVGKDS